jgi:hypothetical protein
VRPRSYSVVGNLEQLIGEGGGDHVDKVRSFQLYRRQLAEPEIITFDELLARAEWSVSLAEQATETGGSASPMDEPVPWEGGDQLSRRRALLTGSSGSGSGWSLPPQGWAISTGRVEIR